MGKENIDGIIMETKPHLDLYGPWCIGTLGRHRLGCVSLCPGYRS